MCFFAQYFTSSLRDSNVTKSKIGGLKELRKCSLDYKVVVIQHTNEKTKIFGPMRIQNNLVDKKASDTRHLSSSTVGRNIIPNYVLNSFTLSYMTGTATILLKLYGLIKKINGRLIFVSLIPFLCENFMMTINLVFAITY